MKRIMVKFCVILWSAIVLFGTQPHTYAQNAETKAQVEFTRGLGPTKPVDPDNPGVDLPEEGVAGYLVIVSVSNFNFGSIPVMATTGMYDIETVKPNIQVVDLRGAGTGWRVSVSVSNFSNTEGASLQGSVIHIKNGHPDSLSGSGEPSQTQNVELTTDGEQYPLITAEEGEGAGLWVMRWYPSSAEKYIQLEVPPGSATLGNHEATIDWILEDSPVE